MRAPHRFEELSYMKTSINVRATLRHDKRP
jgi:hypothetical protein